MFNFDDGAKVMLINDNPHLGLRAGSIGNVWARYETAPISYEVTFIGDDGIEFDAHILENELAVVSEIKREKRAQFAEAS